MTEQEFVEIGNFPDYYKATLAKEILDSNGIYCVIKGVSNNPLDLLPDPPVRLIVGKEDEPQAQELLKAFFDSET